MESQTERVFDKLVWMGPPPLNPARDEQAKKLAQFLGLELQPDGPATRKLILGNLEDWSARLWPRADGQNIYIGLFFQTPPQSDEILARFDLGEITFLWNEQSKLEKIREALSDLLK